MYTVNLLGVILWIGFVAIPLGSYCPSKFIEEPACGFPTATESGSQSPPTDTLQIRVVDIGGTPVPQARIRIWETTPEFPPVESTQTDMAGEALIKVANLKKRSFTITANVGDGLAGFKLVNGSNSKADKTLEIKVEPTKQLDCYVVDYDTGQPIEGARVKVWLSGWQSTRVETDIDCVTNPDGKVQMERLIPGLSARIEATCDGYQVFEGPTPSVDYGLRERNRVDSKLCLELIRTTSYQRVIQSAHLSLPDVSGMSDTEAMNTLTKSYERNQKRSKPRNVQFAHSIGRVHKYMKYLQFPVAFYREAIWKLVESTNDQEVQITGCLWLLNTYERETGLFHSIDKTKVITKLVDHFASDPRIGSVALAIRSYHPDPESPLKKILNENPNREVQAIVLTQLIYGLRTSHHSFRPLTKPDKIESRQRSEREYLNLMLEQFADLNGGPNHETCQAFATRRLEWLDSFAIGSTAPNMKGETIEGEQDDVSLYDFRGKIVILHFWSTRTTPDFVDLERISMAHKDSVQLFGIAYGERESGAFSLRRRQGSWPMLWDSHQGMVTTNGMMSEDQSGLMWGNQKVNYFKWYKTFVLDSSGKIRAAGLTGEKLRAFVADLVAEERKSKN